MGDRREKIKACQEQLLVIDDIELSRAKDPELVMLIKDRPKWQAELERLMDLDEEEGVDQGRGFMPQVPSQRQEGEKRRSDPKAPLKKFPQPSASANALFNELCLEYAKKDLPFLQKEERHLGTKLDEIHQQGRDVLQALQDNAKNIEQQSEDLTVWCGVVLHQQSLHRELCEVQLSELRIVAALRVVRQLIAHTNMQEVVSVFSVAFRKRGKELESLCRSSGVEFKHMQDTQETSSTAVSLYGPKTKVLDVMRWMKEQKMLEAPPINTRNVHIFVDNSNILYSVPKSSVPGSLARLDIHKLCALWRRTFQLVAPIGICYVVGSSNDNNKSVEDRWKSEKFNTKFQKLTGLGAKEQLVDDALIAEIEKMIMIAEVPQHLVLATGDGNDNFGNVTFPLCLKTVLKKGWTAELWAWNTSISEEYRLLRNEFKESFKIITLDSIKDEILFYIQFDKNRAKPAGLPVPNPSGGPKSSNKKPVKKDRPYKAWD